MNKLPRISLKYFTGTFEKVKLTSSKMVYDYIKPLFNEDTFEYIEEVIILLLNTNHETIGWSKISSGGVNSIVIDPKVVFTIALNSGASAMILAHNHPSGNLNASSSDINISSRLKKGGEILDVMFLDSLIVTKNSYKSLSDDRLI